jgi:hypothetical protein
MKNFVSYCLKFLGIFSSICLVSLFFNYLLINYYGYEIKKDQNILVLGDSHTEYAIDDNVFKRSINLSHSADSYFYSFLKIRKLKKENPQIDTLLLALSNHNLLIEYEERWLFNTAHIKSKFRIYTDLMSFSDFLVLFKSNPSAVIQGIIESPKYSIKLLFRGGLKERDLGKFQSSQRNSLEKDIEYRKKNMNQRALEYSQIDTKYLFSITEFCDKNNIELIFVSTPIHPEYIKLKGEEIQLLNDFYSSNLTKYKFLDYSQFDVPDNYFQDLDHLNAKGAKFFTAQLMKDINMN